MARKTYNDEFKIGAAKLVREPGYTVETAAQSLGVDPGSIRTWARKYAPAVAPPAPDASPEQLQRENLRLREEDRRLLMERDILPLNASIARPPFSSDWSPRVVLLRARA
jgi:transposase-like protein